MVLIAVLFLCFGLVAQRLEHNSVTGPMVFTAGGLLCAALGNFGNGLVTIEFLHTLAEITLILLLFGDAATVSWKGLRSDRLPMRLLLIGLPLTMALGVVVGWQLLPMLGFWGAMLVAMILAPTDAALGQAMVTNEGVPERIRRALTVESGLNDGLALPMVMLTASCMAAMGQGELLPELTEGAQRLLLAPPVGALVGLVGGKAADFALARGWTQVSFGQYVGPALAILAFAVAIPLGGNGFIAAFVAGLVFGNTSRLALEPLREFVQVEGELLSLVTFFLFGALMVLPAVESWSIPILLYALASLTLVRMVPVLLSLAGSGVPMNHKMVLGWFGPRGLASILFALLVLEEAHIEGGEEVMSVVVATVLLSIVLHGISAAPLARRLERRS